MTSGSCSQCGASLTPEDLFCEGCGAGAVREPAELRSPAPSARPTIGSTVQGTMLIERTRDHVEREIVGAAAVSDRGHHHDRNEDAFALGTVGPYTVVVVCDGVSTTAHPDRAARGAARAVLGDLRSRSRRIGGLSAVQPAELLRRAMGAAQAAVLDVPALEEGRDAESPSTTIVAALVTPDAAVIASIGDSRAYWISPAAGESGLLTTDDSWAEEAIASGWEPEAAYADQRAHIITRWLGEDAGSIEPAITEIRIHERGHLVLCSDGLWNYFESADQLARLFGEPSDPSARRPLERAQHLVTAALAAGGRDNVTVAVIEADPGASPAPNRE